MRVVLLSLGSVASIVYGGCAQWQASPTARETLLHGAADRTHGEDGAVIVQLSVLFVLGTAI